ncbi:hypothetical protein QEZ54_05430 [Catellatospora sp. KI3]|uniref:hypothetical protein n=1 Tax=Catellatospora sp. KI3 TaxID=3041620 RepID=UPI0024831D75|nr:hypothetical protein [Catellatospora sp. KI3]MDI1460403.1 hypothetical protein [Catellatospora sp. KI3]
MTIEQADLDRYVAAVGAALADLPEQARAELLEDLPAHLAEVAAEIEAEGGGADLADRLGAPTAYAAELRASLGHTGGPSGAALRASRLVAGARRRLRGLDGRLGPVLGYERLAEFLRLLRPAWWVLRGWLAAVFLAQLGTGSRFGLVPRVGGEVVIGLLLLAGCVIASVRLGRGGRVRRRPARLALLAVSLFLAGFGFVYYGIADGELSGRDYQPMADYSNPYAHIRDVWAVGPDGQVIPGVRLIDQNGDPVLLGDCAQLRANPNAALYQMGLGGDQRTVVTWHPEDYYDVGDYSRLAWRVDYPSCEDGSVPPVGWLPGQPQPLPWAKPTATPAATATAAPTATAGAAGTPTPRPSSTR